MYCRPLLAAIIALLSAAYVSANGLRTTGVSTFVFQAGQTNWTTPSHGSVRVRAWGGGGDAGRDLDNLCEGGDGGNGGYNSVESFTVSGGYTFSFQIGVNRQPTIFKCASFVWVVQGGGDGQDAAQENGQCINARTGANGVVVGNVDTSGFTDPIFCGPENLNLPGCGGSGAEVGQWSRGGYGLVVIDFTPSQ